MWAPQEAVYHNNVINCDLLLNCCNIQKKPHCSSHNLNPFQKYWTLRTFNLIKQTKKPKSMFYTKSTKSNIKCFLRQSACEHLFNLYALSCLQWLNLQNIQKIYHHTGNERQANSHPPWGFPQGRGRDGWVRWPACGSDALHTCSGAGGYATSFCVSWRKIQSQIWFIQWQQIL